MSAAWQGGADGVQMQIAPYIRNSETHFRPDMIGDLAYNGIASDVQYDDLAIGLQNDNSWRINSDHTLRAGFTAQNDNVQSNATSFALLDPTDDTISSPIVNDHSKTGQLYGLYLQDEWKLTDKLIMNYGARFLLSIWSNSSVRTEAKPHASALFIRSHDTTTLHWGYARYFTPPPMAIYFQCSDIIAGFAGTTGAQSGEDSSRKTWERANDYDIGITQKLGNRWAIGNDAYYKAQVDDLLDEGQFGSACVSFNPVQL